MVGALSKGPNHLTSLICWPLLQLFSMVAASCWGLFPQRDPSTSPASSDGHTSIISLLAASWWCPCTSSPPQHFTTLIWWPHFNYFPCGSLMVGHLSTKGPSTSPASAGGHPSIIVPLGSLMMGPLSKGPHHPTLHLLLGGPFPKGHQHLTSLIW